MNVAFVIGHHGNAVRRLVAGLDHPVLKKAKPLIEVGPKSFRILQAFQSMAVAVPGFGRAGAFLILMSSSALVMTRASQEACSGSARALLKVSSQRGEYRVGELADHLPNLIIKNWTNFEM